MEQFFTSLSKRQTDPAADQPGLRRLGRGPGVRSPRRRRGRAAQAPRRRGCCRFPATSACPLLVQEIKRLFTQRRRQLASADPKRLAELLAKERPAMVEVMLKALPADLANAVRASLPPLPKVQTVRDVKPEILSIMRWKLEEALKQKGAAGRHLPLHRPARRCSRASCSPSATAWARACSPPPWPGSPTADRETFLGKLPPDQRALAAKAAEAGKAKRLTESDAAAAARAPRRGGEPLAAACAAPARSASPARPSPRRPSSPSAWSSATRADLGKALARWVREEKNRPVKADGGRMDIVEQMERLAQGRHHRSPGAPAAAHAPAGAGAGAAGDAAALAAGPRARESGRAAARSGAPPVAGARPDPGRPARG